jgi:hypothetical protein
MALAVKGGVVGKKRKFIQHKNSYIAPLKIVYQSSVVSKLITDD